ncbi:MAG: UTRA domain-containing protein [Anaerolineae bacterium]|nr:UTRA domain-containing protein [Anaerolineae bacterium]
MSRIDYPIRLQTELEHAITSGEYSKGQTLYVEQIASAPNASHAQALCVLNAAYRKGLVNKTAEETFVVLGISKPIIESVFQHAAKAGLTPTTEVRAVELEPASDLVASKLCVPVGSWVYRQDRTRNAAGQVIANQRNYIPLEVCPNLEDQDLSKSSFQELLEGKYHAIVAQADETYGRAPATESDRMILDLSEDAQVLCVERISSSVTALPLVWAEIHVRPDRYHYVAKLWPSLQALLPTL